MKNILFTLTLSLFVLQSFSQGPTNATLSKDEYLKKSKNQKKIAWILLGAGTVMAVGGYIVLTENFYAESGSAAEIGGFVMLAGIISDLVSIGFFVGASNSKQRAAKLAVTNQKILIPHQNPFGFKTPALTLQIPL